MDLSGPIAEIEKRNPEQILKAAKTIQGLIVANHKLFAQSQDSFAFNVAGRLALQLETALEYPQEAAVAFLQLIQGVCLCHRPSRQAFDSNEALLALLSALSKQHLQVAVIDTLVSVMVRQVTTIRRFEQLNGLKIVCDVFKHSKTATKTKLAIIQFLFFYLVPETRIGRKDRKTTAEKQEILGRYLSNVDGLVRELEMNKPFGDAPIEW